MELWNSHELCKAVNGKSLNKSFWQANSISIDTRSIKDGGVFFALKGNKVDGHKFINHAFENGAVAVVANKKHKIEHENKNIIKVDDTYKALETLGVNRREVSLSKLIAITGSVGKTTVKDYLFSILSNKFLCYANEGNYNNKIGVPLSISQIPKNAKFAIQEMGMSFSNEIKYLSNLTKPDISIITNIGSSHLGNFKNLSDIALAKSEIFYGMKKDGIVILPGESKHLDILKSEARNHGLKNLFFFGTDNNHDCFIISKRNRYNIIEVTVSIMGEKLSFKINSHQNHNILNTAAAILASKTLGLTNKEIDQSLSVFNSGERRGKIYYLDHPSGSKVTLVDDSYNASYESTSSALKSLRNLSLSKPLLILGDMLELGKFSAQEHKKLIPIIKNTNPRLIIFIGEAMSKISKEINSHFDCICFESSHKAEKEIPDMIKNNDLVLIKGSNGMNLNLITSAIINFFKKLNLNNNIHTKEQNYAV